MDNKTVFGVLEDMPTAYIKQHVSHLDEAGYLPRLQLPISRDRMLNSRFMDSIL